MSCSSTIAIERLDHRPSKDVPSSGLRLRCLISKFRYSHLVSLIGYCYKYDEMILVNEFMVCGTVVYHLHKQFVACVGTACGLEYLHTGRNVLHKIIHHDMKSSNILLDENCSTINHTSINLVPTLRQVRLS